MVVRPAVAPQSPAGSENAPPPAAEKKIEEASFSGFSDFGHSSLELHVDDDSDPVDAPAEEAAVLFANHQDSAAQTILEDALKSQQSRRGERLWLMLFDLYRLSGQQSAFEAMGIEYARVFEKSPPGWGGASEPEPDEAAKTAKSGSVRFKGDLLGGNDASFDGVEQALEKNPRLRLDMSKVRQVDAPGCARLLKLLSSAGQGAIELLGRDALISLVQKAIEEEKAQTPVSGKECWLLLLELFQRQGRQEPFEDLAIDYAVTFEESPPSWESRQVAEPEPAAPEPEVASAGEEDDGAYVLSGDIKSLRFGDLAEFAQGREQLVIDCAKLVRIDFVSAGVLVNVLTPIYSTNTSIVFRHPNYLVAELFRVVGLAEVTTVVFAKH
ncbi:MAG: STAS domain-containing protein [Candidatus Accumulibacter sp.]|nr:STAS domain-containing protein [Accumulibacter sp.]